MSDFTQLPVKDGFKGCFDYTNYNGGDTWLNQYADGSGINFNMSNAVKNDGYILFPETLGLGYLIDDIGNNFTLYSIFKCDYSATAVSASAWAWLIAALGASRAYRIYLGGDKNSFGVINCSKANTISANFRDYYITAISVCNGQQNVYVNGELVYTGTTTINYSIDEIGVNLNASGYGGAVPTISNNTANVYVKYIGYATNNHSEVQIQENSNWLLEQYGLKLPEKDSRLAGTDAVAIAYAIARNQESAAALQEVKKAFKDGVREGNDTVVDKTEPIPNDDDEIIIAGDDGDDTFPAEFERGGVYIKTKEITVTDDNGNEVTGVFQLHIGLGDMTYTIYSSTSCDWGIPPKVTLTGNGINKTLIFDGAYDAWKGSTAASAPGVKDGNEFWMTEAKISKSYPGITGKLYWEYSGGYRNRSWKFTGDFATALQAGAYVGTMPFDDVI